MSSKQPPRKRRRTAKASSTIDDRHNEVQVEEPTPTSNIFNRQTNDELVAALIPVLVPAVTQGVVSSLREMGMINPNFQTQQSIASNVSNERNETNSDDVTDTNKCKSISRPLGLGIDAKTKDTETMETKTKREEQLPIV